MLANLRKMFGGERYYLVQILRVIAIIAVLAISFFAWRLHRQQTKQELAYRYTCDLPALAEITGDCLEQVPVPVLREFTVATSSPAGKWTAHTVQEGEMVHPSALMDEPPTNYTFPGGAKLPDGTWGYYLPVSSISLGYVPQGGAGELVFVAVDTETEEMVVIMDHVPIIEKTESGIFLALNPEQVAAMERLFHDELTELTADDQPAIKTMWLIDQPANTDLLPLSVFPLQLTAEVLP